MLLGRQNASIKQFVTLTPHLAYANKRYDDAHGALSRSRLVYEAHGIYITQRIMDMLV